MPVISAAKPERTGQAVFTVRAVLALLWLCLPSCRRPATVVELLIDTDVDSARTMELKVLVLKGRVAPEQLSAQLARTMVTEYTFQRGTGAGEIQYPGSFSVIPAMGAADDRDGMGATVWLRATIGANANAPPVRLDRVVRFSFVRSQRALSRVFLSLACADQAAGCTTVSPQECTVSVRCREQGATCSDVGECVSPDVELETDSGIAMDSSASAVDASTGRTDGVAPGFDGGVDARDAAVDGTDTGPLYTASRQISPLSSSTVTLRRPRVTYLPAPNAVSHEVVFCADRACMRVIERVAGNGSAQPSANLPTGWVYWRTESHFTAPMMAGVTYSPVWQFWVPAVDASSGINRSAGTTADLDGDGYVELVIGASNGSSSVGATTGRVDIYRGRASGRIGDGAVSLEGPAARSEFGFSVRSAGDFNGDGFADLLVGAPAAPVGAMNSAGAVYLYNGSAAGVEPLFRSVVAGSSAGERFGAAVSSAGDINQDGYADILIGAPRARVRGMDSAGRVTVLFGSRGGLGGLPAQVLDGPTANSLFGSAIASAGDFNGDGYGDVVIGLRNSNNGGVNRGEIQVYYGSAMGLEQTPRVSQPGPQPEDSFGYVVAGGGDVNNDGYSDVIAGAPGPFANPMNITHYASIVFGRPAMQMPHPVVTYVDGTNASRFGYSAAMVPDVNGDGCAEMLFGADQESPMGSTLAGQSMLYYGDPTGAFGGLPQRLNGSSFDHSGFAVSGLGDVNGDGFGDIAISAQPMAMGGPTLGAVRVYFGGLPMLNPMPQASINNLAPNELFGISLAMCATHPRTRFAL
jgi:hypothetical protein